MYSVQTQVSDGTLTTINVSIEYFAREDITLYRNLGTTPLVLGTDWQWNTDTRIDLLTDTPIPAGDSITIRRNTSKERAYNIYDGGAAFSRETLDENFKQMIYLAQEFTEGNGLSGVYLPLDMHGFKIINLGTPTDDTDAANKVYVDDAVEAESDARQAADAHLQDQLTGNVPLEASAFSVISWHDQSVRNSVTIPDNKNAWSFGPVVTIEDGQAVTVGDNSFWTIANGQTQSDSPSNVDYGELT